MASAIGKLEQGPAPAMTEVRVSLCLKTNRRGNNVCQADREVHSGYQSPAMDRINSQVEVFTYSDWGGSAKDRSSTSSGMIFVCSCLVASWSRTQKSIALSS